MFEYIRRNHIGGGDSPAILGVDPFKNRMDVFMQKLGMVEELDASEGPLYWGTVLEEPVARKFAERNDVKIRNVGPRTLGGELEWFAGSADRDIVGKKEGLEVKTTGFYARDAWGEEGTDQVPERVIVQCNHYMKIFNYPVWHVAVLIGGNDYREYVLEANKELQEMIFEECKLFREEHILAQERPELDASEASRKFIKAMFPQEKEDVREATPAEIAWLSDLRRARDLIKQAKEIEEETKVKLQDAIGLAAGLEWPGGKVSFKKNKDSKRVDYKSAVKAFEVLVATDTYQSVIEANTTVKEGPRVFRPTFKE